MNTTQTIDGEKIGYIYKITSPTGRVYIGQTVNIKKRIRIYARAAAHNQKVLNSSIIKHGWGAHDFMIMDEVPFNGLNSAEQFYIAICKSFKGDNINGMNLTTGGDNYILSEESINKIKEKRKLQAPFSEETKLKMSQSFMGRKYPNRRAISDESRKKMSISQTGRKHTEETKLKISLSNKGRHSVKLSKESREKLSRSLKEYYSKNEVSKEARDKIAASKKGKKRSEETVRKMSETTTRWWAEKRAKKLLENE